MSSNGDTSVDTIDDDKLKDTISEEGKSVHVYIFSCCINLFAAVLRF